MSSCTLIALARPTFDVAAAEKFYDQARTFLSDLGVTINGPSNLVMTPEDTASAEANLNHDEKLYILFNASFRRCICSNLITFKGKGMRFYFGRFVNLAK